MELEVAGAGVETVEVVDGGNSHAISLEQHSLIVTNPQEILVPTSEVRAYERVCECVCWSGLESECGWY